MLHLTINEIARLAGVTRQAAYEQESKGKFGASFRSSRGGEAVEHGPRRYPLAAVERAIGRIFTKEQLAAAGVLSQETTPQPTIATEGEELLKRIGITFTAMHAATLDSVRRWAADRKQRDLHPDGPPLEVCEAVFRQYHLYTRSQLDAAIEAARSERDDEWKRWKRSPSERALHPHGPATN